jgi:hypothetical protein
MWIFLLWWLVDDHIAAALEAPGLGELPIWVPLIVGLAFSFTFSADVSGKEKRRD